jgi:hypothetical protein
MKRIHRVTFRLTEDEKNRLVLLLPGLRARGLRVSNLSDVVLFALHHAETLLDPHVEILPGPEVQRPTMPALSDKSTPDRRTPANYQGATTIHRKSTSKKARRQS